MRSGLPVFLWIVDVMVRPHACEILQFAFVHEVLSAVPRWGKFAPDQTVHSASHVYTTPAFVSGGMARARVHGIQ